MKIFELGKSRKGIALLMTLWVLVILLGVGTAFAYMALTESRMARDYEYGVQAHYIALAGIEHVIAMLRNDLTSSSYDHLGEDWYDGGAIGYTNISVAVPTPYTATYTVSVTDENSDIDLNEITERAYSRDYHEDMLKRMLGRADFSGEGDITYNPGSDSGTAVPIVNHVDFETSMELRLVAGIPAADIFEADKAYLTVNARNDVNRQEYNLNSVDPMSVSAQALGDALDWLVDWAIDEFIDGVWWYIAKWIRDALKWILKATFTILFGSPEAGIAFMMMAIREIFGGPEPDKLHWLTADPPEGLGFEYDEALSIIDYIDPDTTVSIYWTLEEECFTIICGVTVCVDWPKMYEGSETNVKDDFLDTTVELAAIPRANVDTGRFRRLCARHTGLGTVGVAAADGRTMSFREIADENNLSPQEVEEFVEAVSWVYGGRWMDNYIPYLPGLLEGYTGMDFEDFFRTHLSDVNRDLGSPLSEGELDGLVGPGMDGYEEQRVADPLKRGKLNVNTASREVLESLLPATEVGTIVNYRDAGNHFAVPWDIFNLAGVGLDDFYIGQFHYMNFDLLTTRSSTFRIVSTGTLMDAGGSPIATRRIEAIVDRGDWHQGGSTPPIKVVYWREVAE